MGGGMEVDQPAAAAAAAKNLERKKSVQNGKQQERKFGTKMEMEKRPRAKANTPPHLMATKELHRRGTKRTDRK
jgi:hypothetical protein